LRLRATMENELRAATSALAEADRRYAYVQRQFRVGLATEVEMLKAQVEMLEKKHEVTMLQERLKTIK
jgi:outer membrane protein TolC